MAIPYEATAFIYSVGVEPYDFNILPEHIFDWKMQGVNCATEDYTLGNTSEISFTFETDLTIEVGSIVFVNSFDTGNDVTYSFGNFMFQVTDVTKKKTLLNRYNVTCTSILVYPEDITHGSLDSVIEKSDLSSLPTNYTLMDLARFAARGHVYFDGQELVNTTYIPSNTWWYQGLTYRQLYQWCCQLMGVNDASTLWLDTWSYFSYTGLFAPTTPEGCCFNFNSNNVKSIDIANYQTPVIDKIWFGNESTDVGFSFGIGEQVMMFPSNPLINPTDTSFLSPLYNRVHALQSYTPMKIECFFKYPRITPGENYILNGKVYSADYLRSTSLRFIFEEVWSRTNCNAPYALLYGPYKTPIADYALPAVLSRNNMLKQYWVDENYDGLLLTEDNLKKFIDNAELGSIFSILSDSQVAGLNTGLEFILLAKTTRGFTARSEAWESPIIKYTWEEFVNKYTNPPINPVYTHIGAVYFPKASLEPDAAPSAEYRENEETVTLSEDTVLYIAPYNYKSANNDYNNVYVTVPRGTTLSIPTYEARYNHYSDMTVSSLEQNNVYREFGWHAVIYGDYCLYYKDSNAEDPTTPIDSFSVDQLAWNFIDEQTTSFTNNIENYTWMSYTDDDGNIHYCPIFSWEASPSGIILEGTGNKDRRIENSYLSYDLRTTGKYVDINSAISGTEGEISGVTSTINSLNVRVGNVEAAVNDKVDTSDYNGNTIISKINANGVTQTINSSRVDLSNYVTSSQYTGSAVIDKINSATTGQISSSKVDLSGYSPTISGTDIITAINDTTTVGTIDIDKVDISGYTPTISGTDIITAINDTTTVGTIDENKLNLSGLITSFNGSSTVNASTYSSYAYSLVNFEIPENKHFIADITATKGTILPDALGVANVFSHNNIIKEVDVPSVAGEQLSMTLIDCPTTTTTYYIFIKNTVFAGTFDISYHGWYI